MTTNREEWAYYLTAIYTPDFELLHGSRLYGIHRAKFWRRGTPCPLCGETRKA